MYNFMNQKENAILMRAIDALTELEGTRLMVCPEDYSPSEWKQYKYDTEEIQNIRADVELLLNHLNDH